MSPARLSNYVPGRGPRARPVGRPSTARNSNGLAWPKIQTIRSFSGLGWTGRPECTPIVERWHTLHTRSKDREVVITRYTRSMGRESYVARYARSMSKDPIVTRCSGFVG
jgi:hypothetical protein